MNITWLRSVFFFFFFALLCMVASATACRTAEFRMIDEPVEIWMQSEPERVKGVDWPKRANGEYQDFVAVEPSRDVIVHIRDGPTLNLRGRLLTISLRGNRVRHVSLAMSPDVVSFQEAVGELRDSLVSLGISLSEHSRQNLEKWATLSPDPTGIDTVWGKVAEGPFIAIGEDLVSGVTPSFTVRHHLRRGGFFLSISISVMQE